MVLMTTKINLCQYVIFSKPQNSDTAGIKLVGWLFWVCRPFETVFQSMSGSLPKRGRKERKTTDEIKKMSKQPPPAPTANAVGPYPTVIQIVGSPGTGSLPSTIAPPDHPLQILRVLQYKHSSSEQQLLSATLNKYVPSIRVYGKCLFCSFPGTSFELLFPWYKPHNRLNRYPNGICSACNGTYQGQKLFQTCHKHLENFNRSMKLKGVKIKQSSFLLLLFAL